MAFEATDDFTIGMEEEFFLVDADTGALRPRSDPVMARAREAVGDRADHELQLSQVETLTPVCPTLAELRHHLSRLRRELGSAAEAEGGRLAALGTHPFSHWEEDRITPKPAYLGLERDYQQVAREQLVCGSHVHVGVSDAEAAVHMMNRMRPWLWPLLALSANSPFWLGRDTGYASFRTQAWTRWPMAGIPGHFASRAEYDDVVETLLVTGAIDDPARIYWDVRLSARFPTVELRVTDVCPTVDEAVMVAGLCRALAITCHQHALRGDPAARPRHELLRAAKWRAARYGLGADLIDVVGRRAVPASELVQALLALVRPALEDQGDWDEVSGLVAQTLHGGNGAARQREVFVRSGRLEDVVELVTASTT
ncbi:MAG: carboxylate-amine ligase [Actinomycetota bacterium]|nr:carboxylate-amine ligase [Actinomycetota bacterium]MDQ3575828.1 carboxylate-amine ligase [Actinomycetota bacterium]